MPSSTATWVVIAALSCTACTVHSAMANDQQAHVTLVNLPPRSVPTGNDTERQPSSWSSFFGCENKDELSKISHGVKDTAFDSYLKTKSSRLRAVWALFGIPAVGFDAYLSIVCRK